jgi:hypothetical protein
MQLTLALDKFWPVRSSGRIEVSSGSICLDPAIKHYARRICNDISRGIVASLATNSASLRQCRNRQKDDRLGEHCGFDVNE